MTFIRENNGRIEPSGSSHKRYGGASRAIESDELVTLEQLQDHLGGELVTSVGAFTNVDPDHAIKINTPSGPIYLAVLIYTP